MFNISLKNLLYLLTIFSCFALISAYFIEHILGHQPCNLCLIERIPYFVSIFLIILFFIFRNYQKLILFFIFITFVFASLVSFYHVGIEQGFFDESLVCKINDITHISSQGHYLLIYTKQADKPIIERMTFNEISTKLPESFVRTHRSFIINCRFVTKYTSTNIWLNYSLKVPLSRTYKAQFFEFMTELRAE